MESLLQRTHKLRILTRACRNGTISFETFIETNNSCCAPRFPLIASCCKLLTAKFHSRYVEGSELESRVVNFVKVGHFTSDSATLISGSGLPSNFETSI